MFNSRQFISQQAEDLTRCIHGLSRETCSNCSGLNDRVGKTKWSRRKTEEEMLDEVQASGSSWQQT